MKNSNKGRTVILILGAVALLICSCFGLIGYYFRTEIKVAVCMASEEDKTKCPKIVFIEKGRSEELASDIPIQGKSGLYTVTPPSNGWLKNGWGGEPAENKDLGILSETGTAYLDFTIVPRGEEIAEEFSKSGIQWAVNLDKSSNGELTTTLVEVENASEDAFISRYCWEKDSGIFIFSCAYNFVIPIGDSFIVASGSSVKMANQLVEFEEMLLSIKLTRSQ